MHSSARILVTNVEGPVLGEVEAAMAALGGDVTHAEWALDLVDLVHAQSFHLVVVGFPVVGVALGRFLGSLRNRRSASLRAGTILVVPPQRLSEAGRFLGHGINRVVAQDEIALTLLDTARLLLEVAPRLPLRAPARIMVEIGDRPLRAFCQTENVSRSGMLLRGFGHYPRGTQVEFEISIPGEPAPIRGRALVQRTTDLTAERVEGVGARFVGFEGDDALRLASYLDRHLA